IPCCRTRFNQTRAQAAWRTMEVVGRAETDLVGFANEERVPCTDCWNGRARCSVIRRILPHPLGSSGRVAGDCNTGEAIRFRTIRVGALIILGIAELAAEQLTDGLAGVASTAVFDHIAECDVRTAHPRWRVVDV